jgi:hypothetical protein
MIDSCEGIKPPDLIAALTFESVVAKLLELVTVTKSADDI